VRAAVTSLPFTESVLPTYVYAPLSAAFDGATAEPAPHAEHIASATRAAAYFTKPVVFKTLLLLSRRDRSFSPDRDPAGRQVEAADFGERLDRAGAADLFVRWTAVARSCRRQKKHFEARFVITPSLR
jgi:hypothetical protein